MVPTRRILIAFCAVSACYQALGCSWDYPVWPKSKRSDTPLFRFVVNEHYGAGYIDRQGRIVIQPQYLAFGNHGGDFFEGLANVTTKDEGDFYIDAAGKRVAHSNHLVTGDFAEGFATRWSPSEKKYGYINREGTTAIPATFEVAGSFSEGLAAVRVQGRYGYINHSGTVIIPARFAFAAGFSDGHALVIESGPCQRIGYGPCEYPLNPPYTIPDGATMPSGQVPQRCRYSVIDKNGTVVFSTSYVDAKPFADGFAPVGDGKRWGYIDHTGKVRIPLQLEDAEPFSEGLARVRRGGKVGFIDKTGSMVIQPQFSSAQDFSEGLAVVTDENYKFWFVDPKGKRAIAGEFDGVSSFVMGLAHVRLGREYYSAKWSYIDKTGKAIFTYSDQSGHTRNIRYAGEQDGPGVNRRATPLHPGSPAKPSPVQLRVRRSSVSCEPSRSENGVSGKWPLPQRQAPDSQSAAIGGNGGPFSQRDVATHADQSNQFSLLHGIQSLDAE